MPPLPAIEEYRHLDVNSPDFYSDIRKAASCKNGVGFIIISFGTDLENIDLACKLTEKRAEWGLSDVVIFVKVRDAERYGKLVTGENCYPIGDEKSDVYDIEQITDDKISRMAKLRDYIYDVEMPVFLYCGRRRQRQIIHRVRVRKFVFKTVISMIEVFVFFGRIFIEYKVFDGLYGKTLPVAAEELVVCHRSEEYPG